jgi:hypothetical protein
MIVSVDKREALKQIIQDALVHLTCEQVVAEHRGRTEGPGPGAQRYAEARRVMDGLRQAVDMLQTTPVLLGVIPYEIADVACGISAIVGEESDTFYPGKEMKESLYCWQSHGGDLPPTVELSWITETGSASMMVEINYILGHTNNDVVERLIGYCVRREIPYDYQEVWPDQKAEKPEGQET